MALSPQTPAARRAAACAASSSRSSSRAGASGSPRGAAAGRQSASERGEVMGLRGGGGGGQPAREPGVLGQERAVQIRAHAGAREHALEAGAAVIAMPLEDSAEGVRARPQPRPPAVVLEAGE